VLVALRRRDLNVAKSGRLFRAEVKGRAGNGAVELTPNEYNAMQCKIKGFG
jgi:hypothetical protein